MEERVGSRADGVGESREALLSQMRLLESRIAVMTEALERSERLATIGLAAAMAAHEINNLLTPVIATASAATRGGGDDAMARKAAERALRQCTRAVEMSHRLLAVAGADVEAPRVSGSETVLVESAVEHAVGSLEGSGAPGNVSIEVDIEHGLVAVMPGVDLEQVVLNLLLNAISAIGVGGGVVRVSGLGVTQEERRGREGDDPARSTWNGVRLVVEDDGPGMNTETLRQVFEPFKSGGGKSGGRRRGLGLTVCRHLVEQAGGQISVSSKKGEGTRFVIELPGAGGVSGDSSRQAA